MPSTAIRAACYHPDQRALDLTFVTGRRYRYFAVPPEVAEGFAAARSKGAWFNARIRNRFDFAEIAGDDAG
jgi:lysyl-tRNA synthetase class 2